MRAVLHDRYGPPEVLRLAEVERPVPKEDEVLVRVRATTVTRTDTGLRSAEFFISRFVTGLRRPRQQTSGTELAGEVEAVGTSVSQLAVGDRVFGVRSGAHAEYVCVGELGPLAHMPADLSFDEAAPLVDGAALALACLRTAGPLEALEGRRVVVYGASGAVGTAAVQLAKHFGAHVTAVCNARNVELVRSLGADEVIDYEREDFARRGETYDVVFDAVGKHSFRRSRRALNPGGTFVDTDLGFMYHLPILVLLTRWIGSKRARIGITKYNRDDVLLLKKLAESGEFRAIVDRRYPIEDVVEASRYVETEQKTGNVVLTVAP
jgi:NADPH:quinone reductase-like Zn-dependent oxidoreductase